MNDFIHVDVEGAERVISINAFRFTTGEVYIVVTSDIHQLTRLQAGIDKQFGYSGPAGNYETMLFRGEESVGLYPFGDLPGCMGIGVFQRYDTEDEARDGHQVFMTQVKRELRNRTSKEETKQ